MKRNTSAVTTPRITLALRESLMVLLPPVPG